MDYKKAYLHLFNTYTDLLEDLEQMATEVKQAQETAEELCIGREEAGE